MANVYDKLKEMNLTLPTPPAKGGLYTPVMEFGDHLLYCSGCGPQINGTSINGKLGKELTVEQGQEAALRCMLNLLANLDAKLGDLNRIKRFVKVLAFVNSADDFTQQPQVVNGGSQLLLDLFGAACRRAPRWASTPRRATSPWKSSCWPSTNKQPEAVHHQLKKERSA